MHVLIASVIGLAAVLLPTAALNVLRGWSRQRRALLRAQGAGDRPGGRQ